MAILETLLGLFKLFGAKPGGNVCEKVASAMLPKLLGSAWSKVSSRKPESAFAGVYEQWRADILAQQQDNGISDEKIDLAFEDFFSRRNVVDELKKVLHGQYGEVDFDALAKEIKAACSWAGCPEPGIDLHNQLDTWLRGLDSLLQKLPEYRERYQEPLKEAIQQLGQREAWVENQTRARDLYLKAVIKQHRYIRFSGMAEVSGPDEVEMTKVFVMPKVIRQQDFGSRSTATSTPFPALDLLTRVRSRRAVILGAPGLGKTTLLESFALVLAETEVALFPWADQLAEYNLLPVFYRVRDLDRDLEAHPDATVWDCLQRHCSQRLGLTLPHKFFTKEMEGRGLLVLIDGLDEASSPARRHLLVDLISAFADTLSVKCQMIITSRVHDYARRRFEPDTYNHFELCPFDDAEIAQFLLVWRQAHDPDRTSAAQGAEMLWQAIRAKEGIHSLARNPLLLTMIVRVHFGLGALPESRLELYAKCTETLLKHWTEAKDLPKGPIDLYQKQKFLGQLAYELQGKAAHSSEREIGLSISRSALAKRLELFLIANLGTEYTAYVDSLIERLHARDAVLVSQGNERFGFVHRSFQEYFAAWWMVQQFEEDELLKVVFDVPPGLTETMLLAVAQLSERARRRTLIELLRRGKIEFAVGCLNTSSRPELWLERLVRFLGTHYGSDTQGENVTANECAALCRSRAETIPILKGLFERDVRDSRAIASALELAEVLGLDGNLAAAQISEEFLQESTEAQSFAVQSLEAVGTFAISRNLITNREFELMAPAHQEMRGPYSDADDDPVIYVNLHEARLFCRWLGGGMRLPTDKEWAIAAYWDEEGQRSRRFPWGDDFDAQRCNTLEAGKGRTTPVGSYPSGRSPTGCFDMAGNVWEWTDSTGPAGASLSVIMGGAWNFDSANAACGEQDLMRPHMRSMCIGFRCAKSINPAD